MTGLVFLFGAFTVGAVLDLRRRWREADQTSKAAAEDLEWRIFREHMERTR